MPDQHQLAWNAVGEQNRLQSAHSAEHREHSTNGVFSVAQLLYGLSSRCKGVSPVERVALSHLVQIRAAAGVHLVLQWLKYRISWIPAQDMQ